MNLDFILEYSDEGASIITIGRLFYSRSNQFMFMYT